MAEKHYSELGYKVFFKLKPCLKKLLRIRLEGEENFPKNTNFIIAANHRSYLDPPVINIISPEPVMFLAKEELFKVPVLGWAIKKAGAIPVEKGRKGTKALIKALELLKNGYTVGIFPEGTRARPKQFLKPQAGVGLLVEKAKKPVIPVRIEGTDDVYPVHSKFPKLFTKPIYIKVGKPMYFTDESHTEIANIIMEEIKNL